MPKNTTEPEDALTYDDLADIYKRVTGRNARIQPMERIVKWAEKRRDLFRVDANGYFYERLS